MAALSGETVRRPSRAPVMSPDQSARCMRMCPVFYMSRNARATYYHHHLHGLAVADVEVLFPCKATRSQIFLRLLLSPLASVLRCLTVLNDAQEHHAHQYVDDFARGTQNRRVLPASPLLVQIIRAGHSPCGSSSTASKHFASDNFHYW